MIARGPEEQFLNWYDQFSDAIFRHVVFRVSDREKAKDITQETFIRLWGYVREGKDIIHIQSFIYKIANNLIIDEYRRKETLSLDQLCDEAGFDVPFDDRGRYETEDEARRVHDVIQEIPEQYREAFIMRHIDGLSVKDIAKITGDSENVISVRIHRAIEKIKNRYEQRT